MSADVVVGLVIGIGVGARGGGRFETLPRIEATKIRRKKKEKKERKRKTKSISNRDRREGDVLVIRANSGSID